MDQNTEIQIGKLKSEIESKNVTLEIEKKRFADAMLNSLGEQMMYELTRPPKISENWFKKMKRKLAMWLLK